MEKKLTQKQYLLILSIVLLVIGSALLISGMKSTEQSKGTEISVISPQEDTRAVLALNYHKIANEHLSLSVTVDDFDQHMKWLKEYGYTSISPDDLYEFVTEGKELPEKPVLITFDDGYKDNYTNAYPILKKYGYVGTIFVVTGFLDKYPNYLTWAQAKELSDNGFSIESHTVTHQSMTDASDEKLLNELTKSKEAITEHLGKEPNFLAYPTGTYNLHIATLVKETGYKGAFTIKFENINRNSNVYALERVPIFHTENTNKDFLERIQYLPLLIKYGWNKK